MDATKHEGRALPYVIVRPKGIETTAGYPLVVLLHGFGASMYDLANLSNTIDAEGYVYAFPNAPYRADFGMGQVGYSWFTGRQYVEDPPEGAPSLEEMLDVFIDEVTELTGAEAGRMVLGGFSQGGSVTLRYGMPRPQIFPGLADLSGPFRNPDDLQGLPETRDQRIFIAHGTKDPTVPIDRGGQAAKAFLESIGYDPAYHEYEMGHEINHGVVRDLRAWLHATLPPYTPAIQQQTS
jgi:phospholipase/carboxylesterase